MSLGIDADVREKGFERKGEGVITPPPGCCLESSELRVQ